MEGSLNFINKEVVSTSDDNGLGSGLVHSLEHGVVPVTNLGLVNFLARSEESGVESLFISVFFVSH